VDPHAEYTRRLTARRHICAAEERLFHRIGTARLITGIAAVAVVWLAIGQRLISPWWLIPPALLFLALVLWHQFVFARLSNARRAVQFYERGLSRLEDRWQGNGETGERFRTPDHVYADDLDVLGKGSLYELLCTVRTPMAEQMLAEWLLKPAGIEDVEQRQHAVAELRARFDLREDLFLVGDLVRRDVRPAALMAWGESEPVVFAGLLRMLAPVLAIATVLLLILDLTDLLPLSPFLAALLIELSVIFTLRQKVNHVAEAVEEPAHALDLVAAVLRRFEREQFDLPYLQRLRAGFEQVSAPASQHIERLERYAARLDWAHNQFFLPIAAVLLWREQLALRIEDWRREHGRQVGRWLASVAELEVLCALAGYAFDHPSDPFPELAIEGAAFEAEGIAHPLMKEAVRNDLSLGHGTIGEGARLLIVSGSNMSGKSTLLRTVGLNAVLALAGAPVRARSLRLSPLSIAASIRVVDSLADGRSRFLAEITRLRRMMDLARGDRPLLFLIDELLSGTNSHDRRIGAEAILRGLVQRGAIGLATTHDLALTAISEALSPLAKNVHFADILSDGVLVFDYRLHEGVTRRSNALELMRSVGLEV
jgi:DNA mismatch repair ATPase MutS